MDTSVIVGLIGLIGSVVTIFLTNRFTARAARRAHEDALSMERGKVEADSYNRAKANYEDALKTNREQLEALRGELERVRTDTVDKVTELKVEVVEQRQARIQDRRTMSKIGQWCRTIVRILDEREIPYPPAPAELEEL